MTVSYFGQGGVVTISWADLDEEPPPSPEASEAAIELAPTVGGGWYASCVYGRERLHADQHLPGRQMGTMDLLGVDQRQQRSDVCTSSRSTPHGAVNPGGRPHQERNALRLEGLPSTAPRARRRSTARPATRSAPPSTSCTSINRDRARLRRRHAGQHDLVLALRCAPATGRTRARRSNSSGPA